MTKKYTPKPIGFNKGFKLAIHTNMTCSFCGAAGSTSVLVKSPLAYQYICQTCIKECKEICDADKSN